MASGRSRLVQVRVMVRMDDDVKLAEAILGLFIGTGLGLVIFMAFVA